MAVTSALVDSTFRTGNTGTTSTITGALFGTAFAGRVLVASYASQNGNLPTACTIGGVAATVQDTGGGIGLAYCVNPTGTSGNIVFTFAAADEAVTNAVVALTGANSATPPSGGTISNNSTGSGTINAPANGAMVAFSLGTAAGSWTGATVLIDANHSGAQFSTASFANSSGAISGHSVSYSTGFALVAASFSPVPASNTLSAAQGSFSLSGKAATPNAARSVVATQGSLSLTGDTVTINRGIGLAATQGAFSLTGKPATFPRAISLATAQGSFSLTGEAVGLLVGRSLNAGQGTFVLSGKAASLPIALSIQATKGQFNLNGMGAALVYTPSGGGGGAVSHSNPFFSTPGPMTSLP